MHLMCIDQSLWLALLVPLMRFKHVRHRFRQRRRNCSLPQSPLSAVIYVVIVFLSCRCCCCCHTYMTATLFSLSFVAVRFSFFSICSLAFWLKIFEELKLSCVLLLSDVAASCQMEHFCRISRRQIAVVRICSTEGITCARAIEMNGSFYNSSALKKYCHQFHQRSRLNRQVK